MLVGGYLLPTIDVEVTFRTSVGNQAWSQQWAFIDFDRSEFFIAYIAGDGRLAFGCKDGDSGYFDVKETSSVSLADGQWHTARWTVSNGALTMYRDGSVSAHGHFGTPGFLTHTQPRRTCGGGSKRYGIVGDGSEATTYDGTRNEYYFEGNISYLKTSMQIHTDTRHITMTLNASACNSSDLSALSAPACGGGLAGWSASSAPPRAQASGATYWSFDGSTNYIPLSMVFESGYMLPTIDVEVTFRTSVGNQAWSQQWAFIDFDRSEFFIAYIAGDGRLAFGCKDGDSGYFDVKETSSVSLADGQWHTARWTVSNGALTMYRDGSVSAHGHFGTPGFLTHTQPRRTCGGGSKRYGIVGDGSEATTYDGTRNAVYFDGDIQSLTVTVAATDPTGTVTAPPSPPPSG